MGESDDQKGHAAALAMIDTFASVAATCFDVTWTNAEGEQQAFRGRCKTAYLARILPAVLDDAARKQRNVIVRPRGGMDVTFVQLELWALSRRRAAQQRGTGPDTSRADFVWCMTALTWGWSQDETADRLMEESAKARAQGRAYATLTVRNARLAVERRKQQPKRHP